MNYFDVDDSGADEHRVAEFIESDAEAMRHHNRAMFLLTGMLVSLGFVGGLLIAYYGG